MVKDEASIISYVEFDSIDSWDKVFTICKDFLTNPAKNRLSKIVVKAIIIEKQYIDKDYRNTFAKFHSKKFVTPASRCIRLHFFSNALLFETPEPDVWQQYYCGYVVLRPTQPNSLGRTMLSPRLFNVENAYLCLCTEKVMVNGIDLSITGFPFISQDTDATVCAQSSLWMTLRFFSNRYKWYKEIYPSDLSSLVKSHPQGRSMPGAGLTMIQMADAVRELNFSPLVYSRSEYGSDFLRYAYAYIESGIPILIGLPGHVVVAVGHTSDFSQPCATTTFSFFNGFIINDDNGLPYARIQAQEDSNPFKFSLNSIDSFLVPLPDKVFLSAEQFEKLSINLLKYLKGLGKKIPSFSRIFLTTGSSFRKRVLKRYAHLPLVQSFYLKYPMPHFIWVCELSEPDLFSKSFQCVGEIIWDATKNEYECILGIVTHLPEMLLFDSGAALNQKENYQEIKVPQYKPYTIYNNLEAA